MKKLFSIALLSTMLFAQSCNAYTDPSYDIGAQIGNAIGTAIANQEKIYRGEIRKEFHVDKRYDTSKLKKFVLVTYIPPQEAQMIQGKYAVEIPSDTIMEKLSKSYDIETEKEVSKKLLALKPDLANASANVFLKELAQYVSYTKDGIILMNMHANYTYVSNGYCDIEIIVNDVKDITSPVLYFREQRLDVPNRMPGELADIIAGNFASKFKSTFKNSRRDS